MVGRGALKRPIVGFAFVAAALYAIFTAFFAWANGHFLRDDFASFYIALAVATLYHYVVYRSEHRGRSLA
jgi:hypothetical protein